MRDWNLMETWENLRTRTGEILPIPVAMRVQEVDLGVQVVQNCTQSGKVNMVRSNVRARGVVDQAVRFAASSNNTYGNPKAPVTNPDLVMEDGRLNTHLIRENVERVRGKGNV